MFQQVAGEFGRLRRPSRLATELYRRNQLLTALGALQACLLAGFLVGLAVDPRTVGTEPVWLKPSKFAASIATFALVLAWLTPYFPVPRRTIRRVSVGVTAGSVVEIVLIGGQAARGVESHFNTGAVLDAAVYYTMGATIVGIVALVAWLLARAWRGDFDVAPAFAWGIRLGVLLFVVGSLEGGAMIATTGSATGSGPTLPVLGWNLAGDFRVAHFLGLHALEALPLVGYLAARAHQRGRLDRPVRLVGTVAAAFALALVLTFAHAVAPLVA
jgi:hypothetical protein